MWSFKKNIYASHRTDECVNCTPHDVDIDGQIWTGCNATVEYYNNGDPIPYVDDITTWSSLTTGAWCYYNNDSANEATYGKLYNWFAINDSRGFAPTGYHVPTDIEWFALITYLGGITVAGNALRETGLCHWNPNNSGATNSTGFTAIGAGIRFPNGNFAYLKDDAHFWTATSDTPISAYQYYIYQTNAVQRFALDMTYGFSVRFIKD